MSYAVRALTSTGPMNAASMPSTRMTTTSSTSDHPRALCIPRSILNQHEIQRRGHASLGYDDFDPLARPPGAAQGTAGRHVRHVHHPRVARDGPSIANRRAGTGGHRGEMSARSARLAKNVLRALVCDLPGVLQVLVHRQGAGHIRESGADRHHADGENDDHDHQLDECKAGASHCTTAKPVVGLTTTLGVLAPPEIVNVELAVVRAAPFFGRPRASKSRLNPGPASVRPVCKVTLKDLAVAGSITGLTLHGTAPAVTQATE